jgi:hypothetical protein
VVIAVPDGLSMVTLSKVLMTAKLFARAKISVGPSLVPAEISAAGEAYVHGSEL